MSDVQEKKLSLLEQFIQQRDMFIQQSTQIQNQFQQLQGAIFACNEMISKIEKDNQGEKVDGQVDSKEAEQVA